VHVSEMGLPPEGVDAHKPVAEQFPKGTKIQVAVLEIDAEHRIRLSRAAVPELGKGMTPEAYLKHKSQHELEEKLLRSASKPVKPAAAPRRPGGEGRVGGRSDPRADRRPEGRGDARPEARGDGRSGRPGSRPRAAAGAQAAASDRPARGESSLKPRPGPAGKPEKSTGLGTLGDLLKVKLQQRKN
jgi:hypothetical protein